MTRNKFEEIRQDIMAAAAEQIAGAYQDGFKNAVTHLQAHIEFVANNLEAKGTFGPNYLRGMRDTGFLVRDFGESVEKAAREAAQ